MNKIIIKHNNIIESFLKKSSETNTIISTINKNARIKIFLCVKIMNKIVIKKLE